MRHERGQTRMWIHAKSRRVAGLLLAFFLAIGGGCGDESLDQSGDAELPKAPAVQLIFSLDLEQAVRAGRVPAEMPAPQVVQDTLVVVRDRLRTYGLEGFEVAPSGDAGFEVRLPVDLAVPTDQIAELITQAGELSFRIQVIPEPNQHEHRAREKTWPGTRLEFEDWKAKELARYSRMIRERGAYDGAKRKTDDADWPFFLVKREGRDGTKLDDFEVCEVPDDAHRFDGHIVATPRASVGPHTGAPIVVFDIKPAYQDAFAKWTKDNVGFPMAIILNGEFTGDGRAPTIQSQLTDSVQISLGSMSFADAEKRAKALVTVLQSGVMRVLPELVSVSDPR